MTEVSEAILTSCLDAEALCESLSPEDEAFTRDLMTLIADKWSFWVINVLAEAGRPLRFTRVLEQVEGISQKSLTKTLRGLERDGLITRQMFLEVPPRVEYTITPLGGELIEKVLPLWMWVAGSVGRFQAARRSFDSRRAAGSS